MKLRYISFAFLTLNSLTVSLNSMFEHGVAHDQGRRPTMEDRHAAIDPLSDGCTSLFAIFDGHGGKKVAKYAARNIQQAIENSTAFSQDLTTALHNAFEYLDQNLAQGPLSDIAQNSGSTAVVTLIRNNQLHNAHVGDSRAVLSRNGEALALTHDHKPNKPDEQARIEAADGFVTFGNVPRVCGSLAVSRALGDHALRSAGVIATPEVAQVPLTPQDEFLLLACDGVFEKDMTDQQAITFVRDSLARHSGNPQATQEAAKELIKEAYNRGSGDNISALVVLFNQNHNSTHYSAYDAPLDLISSMDQAHVTEQTELQEAQDSSIVQPELLNQIPAILDNNADNINSNSTIELSNEQNQPTSVVPVVESTEPRLSSVRKVLHTIKQHKGLAVGVGVIALGATAYAYRKPIVRRLTNIYQKTVLNVKAAWQKLQNKKQ